VRRRSPHPQIRVLLPESCVIRWRAAILAAIARPSGGRVVPIWLVSLVVFLAVLASTGGVALAVVGGKTVRITAAPWTVVVREREYVGGPRYVACTGVIVDRLHVLTAGHCAVSGESARPLAASSFRIEAGVSNFEHALASDRPQFRSVTTVQVMPGYVPESEWNYFDQWDASGHDLAVLTLSSRLDLDGADARAARLPSSGTPMPSSAKQLVMAGFGDEKSTGHYRNGTLNEVTKSKLRKGCTRQVLCVFETTDTCWGDSGSGAVEPGPSPTVVGILSEDLETCRPGWDEYVYLGASAARRFILASQ
jgi:Trypsin